ncbi:MAG: tetratricopeptide repeat protein [Microcoleaceae cyanobacterium]
MSSAQSLLKTARTLVQQQQWQAAIAHYQSLIQQRPNCREAYLELGNVFFHLEQWLEAIDSYQQAIQSQPQLPQAYHNLGDALSKLQRWEEAVTAYQQAIELNPKFSWSYNNLGDGLLQLGRWQEAAEAYQQGIKLNPNFALSYHNLGDVYSQLQQWADAIIAYRQAIQRDPNFAWSYNNLGEAFTQQQQWEEAHQTYQKAVELDANLPQIHAKFAETLKQLVQTDQSHLLESYQQQIQAEPDEIQHYYQVLELDPNNAETYLNLGKLLAKKGQLDQAIVAYQRSLQIQPNFEEALNQLEKLRQRSGMQWSPEPYQSEEFLGFENKLDYAKQALDLLNKVVLNNFLNTSAPLIFPELEHPKISIILVLYNRAELTLSCLYSILHNQFKSIEIVIVDNHSTDKTSELLQRIQGAKIILNLENLHFLLACNQASEVATGEYLLFLNNDAQLLGDSLNIAIQTIESSADIGAVGGKIILPDGSLQEAGSIIWQDGSCLGYGRGDSPDSPQYMYRRAVDYCSGAFLLTSRQSFLELGGFDEEYQPAYYEETDYCVRLQQQGKQIIYNPNIAVLHYEFASSSNKSSSDHAIALMERNQQLLISKHQDWFKQQYPADLKNVLFACNSPRKQTHRLLMIDDRVPHPYLGSGYTRSYKILSIFEKMGYLVTLYPTDLSYQENWTEIYSDIPQAIEVMRGYGLLQLEDFLKERPGYYDVIWVSRPHNMEHLNYVMSQADVIGKGNIIYDAEALYCLREFEQQRLKGEVLSPEEMEEQIKTELKLAEKCDQIISVSPQEQQRFLAYGYEKVAVLGHSLQDHPTPNIFEQRQHILFVGSVYDIESPNADSILWLAEEIFPKMQQQLGDMIKLLIVGNNTVDELKQRVLSLNNSAIKLLGRVEDLTQFYNQARLFVAPTRFAAGIPHKVHEAAAYGIPVVTTPLIAAQLGWQHESDLLVAEDTEGFVRECIKLYQNPELWEQLRLSALNRIQIECSPAAFSNTVISLLEEMNNL